MGNRHGSPPGAAGYDVTSNSWRRHQALNSANSSLALRIGQENHRQQTSTRADVLVRTPLTEENAETVTEYFRVYDRLMRSEHRSSGAPEHRMSFNIVSIERIENRLLDMRMWNCHGQLLDKECKPELYFHDTTGDVAEKIIQEGFKIGTRGMYGKGIYFATDTTKAAQCSKDNGVKTLLVCEVLLGRPLVLNGPQNDLNYEAVRAAGFDSVFAKRNTRGTGGVLNDEYIVYRPEQASPRYLVKFTA